MDSLLRKLLAPVMLAMWGAFYWMWSGGLLVPPLIAAMVLSHIICMVIFYHFVYVFNYGYSVIMVVLPILFGFAYPSSFPALVVIAVSVLYGLRLGSFSWQRYHDASFAERTKRQALVDSSVPLPVKVITWLFTSALMFCIAFNVWVVAASESVAPLVWAGVALMVAGPDHRGHRRRPEAARQTIGQRNVCIHRAVSQNPLPELPWRDHFSPRAIPRDGHGRECAMAVPDRRLRDRLGPDADGPTGDVRRPQPAGTLRRF